MNQEVKDLEQDSNENQKEISYKRKYEGNIRITKYNNGWIEVWNPGNQRLMNNKQLNYKVIWLKNGDIKQQWFDRKIMSYYFKQNELVQINVGQQNPLYFFVKLNQLQKMNQEEKSKTGQSTKSKAKTVLFKSGRIQQIKINENQFNGFSL